MKFKDPLTKMAVYAILTSIMGIFAGLLLGSLILVISINLLFIGEALEFIMMAPFFGMVWGALIGAVLGGIVGLKK
jgi:hypothetical protein